MLVCNKKTDLKSKLSFIWGIFQQFNYENDDDGGALGGRTDVGFSGEGEGLLRRGGRRMFYK